jgi:hypothetical protein
MATLLPLNTFESDAGDLILLWHFKISSKFKHQKTSRATVARDVSWTNTFKVPNYN